MEKENQNTVVEEAVNESKTSKSSSKTVLIIISVLLVFALITGGGVWFIVSLINPTSQNSSESITDVSNNIPVQTTSQMVDTVVSEQDTQVEASTQSSNSDTQEETIPEYKAKRRQTLIDIERYVNYIAYDVQLLQIQIDLYEINNDPAELVEMAELYGKITDNMVKICERIEGDETLELMLIEYSDIPVYTASTSVESFSKKVCREGNKLVTNYSVVCNGEGISYTDPRKDV